MRLEPMEMFLLERIRDAGGAPLSLETVLGDFTSTRQGALRTSLARLEREHLVVRFNDAVLLTDAGRQYLGIR